MANITIISIYSVMSSEVKFKVIVIKSRYKCKKSKVLPVSDTHIRYVVDVRDFSRVIATNVLY